MAPCLLEGIVRLFPWRPTRRRQRLPPPVASPLLAAAGRQSAACLPSSLPLPATDKSTCHVFKFAAGVVCIGDFLGFACGSTDTADSSLLLLNPLIRSASTASSVRLLKPPTAARKGLRSTPSVAACMHACNATLSGSLLSPSFSVSVSLLFLFCSLAPPAASRPPRCSMLHCSSSSSSSGQPRGGGHLPSGVVISLGRSALPAANRGPQTRHALLLLLLGSGSSSSSSGLAAASAVRPLRFALRFNVRLLLSSSAVSLHSSHTAEDAARPVRFCLTEQQISQQTRHQPQLGSSEKTGGDSLVHGVAAAAHQQRQQEQQQQQQEQQQQQQHKWQQQQRFSLLGLQQPQPLLQQQDPLLQQQQPLLQQQQRGSRQLPLRGVSAAVGCRAVASLAHPSEAAAASSAFANPAAAAGGSAAAAAAATAAASAGLGEGGAAAAAVGRGGGGGGGGASVKVAPRPYYFDYQATSPIDPRVTDAMMFYQVDCFGNPHSNSHAAGWEARRAVEHAREEVAAALGLPASRSREVIFTSGATESNNLAIKGVVAFQQQLTENADRLQGSSLKKPRKNHIITTQIEHKCVLQCCRLLQLEWQQSEGARGAEVTFLPVSSDGLVSPAALAAAIKPETLLVSIMHVNNEIGVKQDLEGLGRVCRERGVLFHTDAAQSFGKETLDVDRMHVDLLSLSGHKIYGPKGVGALFVRGRNPKVRLRAVIDGGGQERGLRSGTLATPLIVGLGKAASLAMECRESDRRHIKRLFDLLLQRLQQRLPYITVNGSVESRYVGNLNISFSFVEGESLLMSIGDGLGFVVAGSACTSESLEPSYVLRALGVGEETAHTSIRIGLGRFTREEEVLHCADRLVAEVTRLREMSPLYDAAMEAQQTGEAAPKMVWTLRCLLLLAARSLLFVRRLSGRGDREERGRRGRKDETGEGTRGSLNVAPCS
ncbi:hypothetical protein Efla_003819 [Eimeria flavescens]